MTGWIIEIFFLSSVGLIMGGFVIFILVMSWSVFEDTKLGQMILERFDNDEVERKEE